MKSNQLYILRKVLKTSLPTLAAKSIFIGNQHYFSFTLSIHTLFLIKSCITKINKTNVSITLNTYSVILLLI